MIQFLDANSTVHANRGDNASVNDGQSTAILILNEKKNGGVALTKSLNPIEPNANQSIGAATLQHPVIPLPKTGILKNICVSYLVFFSFR